MANPVRIGLVLSGGGARGTAHIGVLKALRDLHIPIHAIAGTSMGALVSGAYASGLSVDEIERRVISLDWNSLFNDDPPRAQWPVRRKRATDQPVFDFAIGHNKSGLRLPKGVIAGQKIQLFLADLVKNSEGIADYDHLPIRLRVVATDLEHGRIKIFDRGPLALSLRASMSVPGLFAPLELPEGLFVDGGLVRNLPVDIVRRMGVDAVIAVNLGASYLPREQLENIAGITAQMVTILTEQNVERSIAELDPSRDILIIPELGEISSSDFSRSAEAIAQGEIAARKLSAQLKRYSVSPEEYAQWENSRRKIHPPDEFIDAVRIQGLDNVNRAIFSELENKYTQQPLMRTELEKDLQVLYGRGDFERINYRLLSEDKRNILLIEVEEKSWGPGYLSFGLDLLNDLHGDNRFGLRTNYRRTWINSRGAEVNSTLSVGSAPHFFTELYQPLSLTSEYFIAPYLDLSSSLLHIYANDKRIARYDVRNLLIGVDWGKTNSTHTEMRLGGYWRRRNFTIDTGNLILPEGNVQESGVRARLVFDTLDGGYVPNYGQRFTLEYFRPMYIMNSSEAVYRPPSYHHLFAQFQRAFSNGSHRLLGIARAGTSIGDSIPYYDQFSLGGFLNLSGYAPEQFRGDELLYGGLVYYRQIAALSPPLGRGLYLGASLEIGQVWGGDSLANRIADIDAMPDKIRYGGSLFFGADTWLGPFYVGFGRAGSGSNSFYMLLGQP